MCKSRDMRIFTLYAQRSMLFGLLLIVLAWSGLACELINPEEPIPGYVVVEPFQLSTQASTQGSNSSRITEVWVSVGSDFLGAYRLPATIPILGQGQINLTLQAGIKDNGIGELPEIYPFYQPVSATVNLQPNQMVTLRPATTYLPEARFAFIENFEGSQHIFRVLRIGSAEQALQRSAEAAFEGQAGGFLRVDTVNPVAEIATVPVFSGLNATSPFVYLELDYKSEAPVLVGLVGYGSGLPASGVTAFEAGFVPRENWTKIYFNLSQLIFSSRFEGYQIVLQANLPARNGVPVRSSAVVQLDNIKLVHF